MNGILIIDKPEGITSHDVVSRVRRILNTKRVGHTGTLDPFATGVMVILVGQATRLAQFLDKDDKEYVATVRFGYETDTGDRTGTNVSGDRMPDEQVERSIRDTDWSKVFERFRGEILQTPPMYSAKKVMGRKLYEHARRGEVIAREPVRVFIRKLKILEPEKKGTELNIGVQCSAGTYIRTLAEDIGRAVGTGAHLVELRRTRAGRFDISLSRTLDELERLVDPAAALLPMSEAVAHLPEFVVPEDRVTRTASGLPTRIESGKYEEGEAVRMVEPSGEILAIGFYDEAENAIRPKIVLV